MRSFHGKRTITLDTSLRLGRFFGPSSRFWFNVQTECDLQNAKQLLEQVAREVHPLRTMGDKSPKATNKKAVQKRSKANTNMQKKSDSIAAKQIVKARK